MDDLGLLERMRRGDESAFAELFARHRASIYRYAAHMAGPDCADDVVQDVFLALLRQLDRYDATRGDLRSYLLGIARHHALKRFGGPPVEQWPDDDDAAQRLQPSAVSSDAGNPLEALTRAEIVDRVRAAIARLPPAFRETVVLCDLNELDYAAASAVMKCPLGTVRSRLHRARALLVRSLAEMRRGVVSVHDR